MTSAKRSTSLPDVPTVTKSGYEGFDVSTWYGVFMPAGTPKDIVVHLNREVNKLLDTPYQQGAEPKGMAPERFSELLQADYRHMKNIVQQAGVAIE